MPSGMIKAGTSSVSQNKGEFFLRGTSAIFVIEFIFILSKFYGEVVMQGGYSCTSHNIN